MDHRWHPADRRRGHPSSCGSSCGAGTMMRGRGGSGSAAVPRRAMCLPRAAAPHRPGSAPPHAGGRARCPHGWPAGNGGDHARWAGHHGRTVAAHRWCPRRWPRRGKAMRQAAPSCCTTPPCPRLRPAVEDQEMRARMPSTPEDSAARTRSLLAEHHVAGLSGGGPMRALMGTPMLPSRSTSWRVSCGREVKTPATRACVNRRSVMARLPHDASQFCHNRSRSRAHPEPVRDGADGGVGEKFILLCPVEQIRTRADLTPAAPLFISLHVDNP
jgi:hypothetical protein